MEKNFDESSPPPNTYGQNKQHLKGSGNTQGMITPSSTNTGMNQGKSNGGFSLFGGMAKDLD